MNGAPHTFCGTEKLSSLEYSIIMDYSLYMVHDAEFAYRERIYLQKLTEYMSCLRTILKT